MPEKAFDITTVHIISIKIPNTWEEYTFQQWLSGISCCFGVICHKNNSMTLTVEKNNLISCPQLDDRDRSHDWTVNIKSNQADNSCTWSRSSLIIGRSLVQFPWSACLKCAWARYWTPNCSWCAGQHLAWQPPTSVYEGMYELVFGQKRLLNALNVKMTLVTELWRFWQLFFVTFTQNYASCFPTFSVFLSQKKKKSLYTLLTSGFVVTPFQIQWQLMFFYNIHSRPECIASSQLIRFQDVGKACDFPFTHFIHF